MSAQKKITDIQIEDPRLDYAQAVGEFVIAFGQLERIYLNFIKRCDQKISKKSLGEIYEDYSNATLSNLIRKYNDYTDKKKLKVNKRSITLDIPKEYTVSLHKKVEAIDEFRNQLVHSFLGKEKNGRITIRHIENQYKKPAKEVANNFSNAWIKKIDKKTKEVKVLCNKIDGLQR
ncbi:MAG: hypothetical protein OEY94_08575 [Alphaproteobacteria bacterium]|nr:hypothetical protein [Alphaproteobacteria bacterium]